MKAVVSALSGTCSRVASCELFFVFVLFGFLSVFFRTLEGLLLVFFLGGDRGCMGSSCLVFSSGFWGVGFVEFVVELFGSLIEVFQQQPRHCLYADLWPRQGNSRASASRFLPRIPGLSLG